jgi:hypothetical protein
MTRRYEARRQEPSPALVAREGSSQICGAEVAYKVPRLTPA